MPSGRRFRTGWQRSRRSSSRAEHRLLLRQDNADLRLRRYGHTLGLITDAQLQTLEQKESTINETIDLLEKTNRRNTNLAQYLKRPEVTYTSLAAEFDLDPLPEEIARQVELHLKYAGYIERQQKEIEKLQQIESISIPHSFTYTQIEGLRNEAKEVLEKIKPVTLGQASRLAGVNPADISILMVALKRHLDAK